MSEQDAFDRILASLHQATLDDAHWSETSELMDEACGTKGTCLLYGDGNSDGDVRIFLTRFLFRGQRRKRLEREYLDVYHPLDERVPRVRRLPDSQLVHVANLFTDDEIRTSVVYNEVLARCGGQNSLTVRLDGPHESRIVWTIADPIDGDGWTFARTKKVRRLLPHLRHYVTIRQAIAEAGALGTSLTGLLLQSGIGVIQLDGRARIMAATDRARSLLLEGNCLSDRDGLLRARSRRDNAVLQQLLARALPPIGKQGVGGSMMLSDFRASPGLDVHVRPVGDGERELGAHRIAALVLITEPAGLTRIDPALLRTTLDLTPTESRVAALMAEGRTVRDIAELMARSENTIRWHIRRIYDKHGISREVELVRLVLAVNGPSGRSSGLQPTPRHFSQGPITSEKAK